MTPTNKMSKTDRSELKSLLLRRFKSLKGDVTVRVLELKAEAERDLDASYMEEDQLVREMAGQIEAVKARAEADADRLLCEAGEEAQIIFDQFVSAHPTIRVELQRQSNGRLYHGTIRHDRDSRQNRLKALFAGLDAAGATAKQQLDVQEVDMRTTLAIQTLETSEAMQFLERIPTIGELVPMSRLNELMSGDGRS